MNFSGVYFFVHLPIIPGLLENILHNPSIFTSEIIERELDSPKPTLKPAKYSQNFLVTRIIYPESFSLCLSGRNVFHFLLDDDIMYNF